MTVFRFCMYMLYASKNPRLMQLLLVAACLLSSVAAMGEIVPPVLVQREANRWPVAPAGVVVTLDAPTSTSYTLFIPEGLTSDEAKDATLAIHFHGASWFIQQEHTRRGARHPLLVANAKVGDAVYETDVMTPGVFESVMNQVNRHLSALHPGANVAKLELSGFSAGYAGVRGVLRLPVFEPMVSRVMLNDSVYVGDGPDSAPPDDRRPRSGPDGITPFIEFARKAAVGERTFLMEFSSTPSFRSVGPMDCARAIIAALDIPVTEVAPNSIAAARDSADYQLAWIANQGQAHFWCYRAEERPIHLAHVRNQADMWLLLDARSPADLLPVMTVRSIKPTEPAVPTTLLDLGTSGTVALFVPQGYKVPKNGAVELSIHFHGATWFVIQEHQRRGNGDPLVVLELGQGSTAYRVPFEAPTRFSNLQAAVVNHLRTLGGPEETRIDSMNITSFSAGYGAVREIVKSDANVQQIKRIILADSLYGSLEEAPLAEGRRVAAAEHVTPWIHYATSAMKGERTLLVLTSDIAPGTYAGTHEVALALTQAIGATPRSVPANSLPAAMEGLPYPLRTCADSGGYHWWAYAGNDAQVHMTIARHIGSAWEALDQLGDW